MLKTVGRQAEGIAAYRRAIDLEPALGEAWWSLANLKTVTFDDADIAAMEAALAAPDLSDEDRFHLDFALGKAFEDRRHAERGIRAIMRRAMRCGARNQVYDAGRNRRASSIAASRCSPPISSPRGAGRGCDAPDPIFILGMPRAGSTLIEQILASHSQVEGTAELPDIPALARREPRLSRRHRRICAPTMLRALGEEYLQRTRIQRRTDRPLFIDKLPNNWAHVPLIHLILPNAKIIDARRHPLGCCFSNFKQHFARGQAFSYDLTTWAATIAIMCG